MPVSGNQSSASIIWEQPKGEESTIDDLHLMAVLGEKQTVVVVTTAPSTRTFMAPPWHSPTCLRDDESRTTIGPRGRENGRTIEIIADYANFSPK